MVPRSSPLATTFIRLRPEWVTVAGMPVPGRLPEDTAVRAAALGICDVSALPRTGFKGPGAANWLAAQGLSIPGVANSWCFTEGGALVARLGRSEFLVEDGPTGGIAMRTKASLLPGEPGVYPVLRQDCALALVGERVGELFVQTCNVDFGSQDPAARGATLTQMVGVGVTVLQTELAGVPCWRIWCDGTMAPYLWETLVGIAGELGGGPVGLATAFPAWVA
ncbi:MAG: hypothetical protein KIT73_00855 [Burkholderiales bacterium]|nr:hypothetical protein [Burkholderiales bacterium]